MSQKLIHELTRENLCTHFILPLLKLNKHHFVASNFVNCFLVKGTCCIVVQVIDSSLLSRRVLTHSNFMCTYENEDKNTFLMYRIPATFLQDLEYFEAGRFSMFSKNAKETIIRYSGLDHEKRQKNSKEIRTDARLLALNKHPVLKEAWERMLSNERSVVYLTDSDELLSIPGEETFIDITNLKKVQP